MYKSNYYYKYKCRVSQGLQYRAVGEHAILLEGLSRRQEAVPFGRTLYVMKPQIPSRLTTAVLLFYYYYNVLSNACTYPGQVCTDDTAVYIGNV